MAETVYELNDIAHLTVAFTVSGVATDPTTVTGTVRKPDGTQTSYVVTSGQIVKDSTGNYHLDVTVDKSGWWAYKLVGTGVATDTGQGSFYVNADTTVQAQKNYVLVDELKTALSLTAQSFADIDIQRACSAASRAIDGRTGRVFYTDTTVRYYSPDRCDPAIDLDVQVITELALDVTGNSTFSSTFTQGTDFDLEPFNAATLGRPYERIRLRPTAFRSWPNYPRSVRVTGTFGWATVPDPVNQYALVLAAKLLNRATKSPEGVLVYGLDQPTAIRIARNDPDFNLLLGSYDLSRPGA